MVFFWLFKQNLAQTSRGTSLPENISCQKVMCFNPCNAVCGSALSIDMDMTCLKIFFASHSTANKPYSLRVKPYLVYCEVTPGS